MSKAKDDEQSGTVSQWQVLWIKAVALSWKDPAFKKELLADPAKALKDKFGYTLPPHLTLKVHPVGKIEKQEGDTRGSSFTLPAELKKGEVTLPLPSPPDDTQDHALALASLMEWNQNDGCCGNPCCS